MKSIFLLHLVLPLLTALAGWCPAQETQKADFFDIISKSPAEVARSVSDQSYTDDMEVLVSGFVGLPMSVDHRREFIAGLRADLEAKSNYITRLCLLNLLEEDKAYADALALVRKSPKPQREIIPDQIREIGLLWKSGKETEAADLASRISTTTQRPDLWLSLLRINVIKNRPQEAMRLLDFLEKLPQFPVQLRHSLVVQHLEIARRNGLADALIDQSSSPILQAVWNSALGRKDRALDNARAAGPSPAVEDIELLMLAVGLNSPARDYAKAALATAELALEKRRTLLRCFSDSMERFEQWTLMPSGHGDTVDLLEALPATEQLEIAPKAKLAFWEIVKSHPENARLALLAAQPAFSAPDRSKPLLLEAAKAVRKLPQDGSHDGDPAKSALEILVKTSNPAELEKLLLETPGFGKLPPEDQLRYLIAAKLDKRVVETMARCRFDLPSQWFLGSSLISYLNERAYGYLIPNTTIAAMLDRLPEIVLGSFSKADYSLIERTRNALTFLANQDVSDESLAKATNRLVASAGDRGPEIRQQVIGAIPEVIWTLPGLDFPRPEQKPPSAPSASTAACLAISIFSPPDITFIGNWTPYPRRRIPPDFGRSRADPITSTILGLSPWAQNIRGITDPQRFDPTTQAKLRALFGQDRSRTLIYDLLVSTGVLASPDPEVKALAEQQIASINTPLPEHPAAGAFMFFHKIAKGEPAKKAAVVLEGYESYLLSTRQRIMPPAFGPLKTKQSDMDVLQQHLGLFQLTSRSPTPQENPESPKPLSDYDRLQFFDEAEKLDSPEAIALAKDVLFRFVDSNRAELWSVENLAIRSLVITANFQRFLDDLRTRMEEAGKSELEIQRALYRVHLYRIVHSKGEIYPFAKRVLELDPTDTTAAADVLAAAAAESDRPLALTAMETLCRKSPFALARAISAFAKQRQPGETPPKPGPLSLFVGPDARQVAELMMRIPFQPDDSTAYRTDPSITDLLPLYFYFAQNDITQLRPVMRWARAFSPAHGSELTKSAEFLVRHKRTAEAVDLLADAYFAPFAAAQESDLRFQPKPTPGDWTGWSLDVYELSRLGILKPLAEAESRYPLAPETSKAQAMIALAANPTPETWDRIVPPLLAAHPVGVRPELRKQLEALISSNMPEADALNRRIALEKQAADSSPPTLDTLSSKILLASESGVSRTAATDWIALNRLLAAAKPEQRVQVLSRLSWPMAKIAADQAWLEFIGQARNTDGFPKACVKESSGKVSINSIASRRLQNLVEILLPNLKPDEENSSRVLSLFTHFADEESPDAELLQKFRPWIEFEANRQNYTQSVPLLQLFDLLTGDPSAASPQVEAVFTGESWRVSWSLAGYRSSRIGYPSARKFPFLDGLFDLEILAGTHSDRLDSIQTIPAATATGRVDVKLPHASRFVSILAKKRDGGILRWAAPAEIGDPIASEAITLPATLEHVPAAGPFFLDDAFRLTIAPETSFELADLPWAVGAPPPQVSGWITGAYVTQLFLSFRNDANVEIEAKPLQLNTPDLGGMPHWERFFTPRDLVCPSETEKVALVVRTSRYDRTHTFQISGLRLTSAPPAPDLPAGLSLLGRVPGINGFLVMDKVGNRFATASRQGFGVFDFSTRQFSEWIPAGVPAGEEGVDWMAFAGDRIVFATPTGNVHVLSLLDRSVRQIVKISDFDRYKEPEDNIQLSPDGQFLAWTGLMAGIHLMKIDAAPQRERLLETPQIRDLSFDAESKNLEARGDGNRYTLSLANWETAPLAVTRADDNRPSEKRRLRFGGEDGRSLTEPRNQISFQTDYDRTLADVRVSYRTAVFPPGLLGMDGNGFPFYIDSYGRILRIEPEKLKGYEPPPANKN